VIDQDEEFPSLGVRSNFTRNVDEGFTHQPCDNRSKNKSFVCVLRAILSLKSLAAGFQNNQGCQFTGQPSLLSTPIPVEMNSKPFGGQTTPASIDSELKRRHPRF
jgi:hypothetical protein